MPEYTLEKITLADLAMFKLWLDQPEAARLSELRRSYPVILTDPDPKNIRAIKSYARAGFRPLDIVPCEDGDPVQVMIHP